MKEVYYNINIVYVPEDKGTGILVPDACRLAVPSENDHRGKET